MKVLIAEDSPLVAERLKELLSELDQVEIIGPAPDGDAAVQLFQRHRPGVALLDLHMPGHGGLDALLEIRKQGHSCAVVMLTNYDLPEYRDACLRAGADFFLRKSAEFERVVEIVREAIGNSARQDSSLVS
jgi:DNA-binding NarL/FixJ family response regulator